VERERGYKRAKEDWRNSEELGTGSFGIVYKLNKSRELRAVIVR